MNPSDLSAFSEALGPNSDTAAPPATTDAAPNPAPSSPAAEPCPLTAGQTLTVVSPNGSKVRAAANLKSGLLKALVTGDKVVVCQAPPSSSSADSSTTTSLTAPDQLTDAKGNVRVRVRVCAGGTALPESPEAAAAAAVAAESKAHDNDKPKISSGDDDDDDDEPVRPTVPDPEVTGWVTYVGHDGIMVIDDLSAVTAKDADAEKEKGNVAFKAGDFPPALVSYSRAIAITPANHVLYSNRSAAHFGAKDYARAEADASRCTSLAPDFARGWVRRAMCSKVNNLHSETYQFYLRAASCGGITPETRKQYENKAAEAQAAIDNSNNSIRTINSKQQLKPGCTHKTQMHLIRSQVVSMAGPPGTGRAAGQMIDYSWDPYCQPGQSFNYGFKATDNAQASVFPAVGSHMHRVWKVHLMFTHATALARAAATQSGASTSGQEVQIKMGITELYTNAAIQYSQAMMFGAGDMEALMTAVQMEGSVRGAIGRGPDQAHPFTPHQVVDMLASQLAAGEGWQKIRPRLAVDIRSCIVSATFLKLGKRSEEGIKELTRGLDILCIARKKLDPASNYSDRGHTLRPSFERGVRVFLLDMMIEVEGQHRNPRVILEEAKKVTDSYEAEYAEEMGNGHRSLSTLDPIFDIALMGDAYAAEALCFRDLALQQPVDMFNSKPGSRIHFYRLCSNAYIKAVELSLEGSDDEFGWCVVHYALLGGGLTKKELTAFWELAQKNEASKSWDTSELGENARARKVDYLNPIDMASHMWNHAMESDMLASFGPEDPLPPIYFSVDMKSELTSEDLTGESGKVEPKYVIQALLRKAHADEGFVMVTERETMSKDSTDADFEKFMTGQLHAMASVDCGTSSECVMKLENVSEKDKNKTISMIAAFRKELDEALGWEHTPHAGEYDTTVGVSKMMDQTEKAIQRGEENDPEGLKNKHSFKIWLETVDRSRANLHLERPEWSEPLSIHPNVKSAQAWKAYKATMTPEALDSELKAHLCGILYHSKQHFESECYPETCDLISMLELENGAYQASQELVRLQAMCCQWGLLSEESKADSQSKGRAFFDAELQQCAEVVRKEVESCSSATLDLSGKVLHRCGCIALIEALNANTTVTEIDLEHCRVMSAGMKELVALLTGSRGDSIQAVNLSCNMIVGTGGQHLLDEVVASTSFEQTAVDKDQGSLWLRKLTKP